MVKEEQRYRAYTLNILGIGLTTPLGKVFFDLFKTVKDTGWGSAIFYFIVSIALFIAGLTFIEMGRRILYYTEKKHGNKQY